MNTMPHVLAACLLVSGTAAPAQMLDKKALSLVEARKVVAAATTEAKKNNWNMVIVVVDDAGFLLTLDRLDHTQLGSVDVAIGKARTAALFRRPTMVFEDSISKGRTALLSFGQVMVQGGTPIQFKGEVVGAIGVSGGTSQQDEQVAIAGAAVIDK